MAGTIVRRGRDSKMLGASEILEVTHIRLEQKAPV